MSMNEKPKAGRPPMSEEERQASTTIGLRIRRNRKAHWKNHFWRRGMTLSDGIIAAVDAATGYKPEKEAK